VRGEALPVYGSLSLTARDEGRFELQTFVSCSTSCLVETDFMFIYFGQRFRQSI
jgi:hypothetical protein